MKASLKYSGNRYIFSVVFAALIAVSGFFIIPIGVIPVVLKNLFVVLAGTVLGGIYGGLAVLVFLAAGLIGIPVFVIGGGIGVFNTPLGGYLAGYFFASLAAGLICGKPKTGEKKANALLLLRITAASAAGFSIILFCGVFYMMRLNSITFPAAMAAGFLPFIPGDLIKLAASVPLALKLRPIAARYINPEAK
ncbi:MAG: biotin transporter BioY [Treponema sp.]|jgi:biotin transport system substrate-specific component|nr:biotin transporter BioY [Treponema sp.]